MYVVDFRVERNGLRALAERGQPGANVWEIKGSNMITATSERVITYLLVDDDEELADSVQQCFGSQESPSQVHHVKAGADCLAYLAAEEPFADRSRYPYPDVLLLDIRTPEVLDAFQTLKAIRADPCNSSVTVVMLTNSTSDDDMRCAYALGADGYIVKSDSARGTMEKLQQLRQSLERQVRLSEQSRHCGLNSSRDTAAESAPSTEVQSVLACDEDAAFETRETSPRLAQTWRAFAVGLLIMLLVLFLAMITYAFFYAKTRETDNHVDHVPVLLGMDVLE